MMKRPLIAAALIVVPLAGAIVPAQAAPAVPVPSAKACSVSVDKSEYACMEVAKRKVASGDTAVFTGHLSKPAMKNLKAWTKGDNIVCLDRFKPKAEADGSWPWTTMDAACTTVRKDGTFTINAEFGRKGLYYYGLEMGPCRAGADMCGNGDPGLLGVMGKGDKVVALRTT